MWRVLLTALVIPLAMIVTAPAALACSCAAIPFDDQVRDAEVVFTGTAVASRDDVAGPVLSSTDPLPWTFAVDRVYRGAVGAQQIVVTARSGASCGAEFQVGRHYLVLASGAPAAAGLCNGTQELAGAVPAVLGPGAPPEPPPSTSPPPVEQQRNPFPLPWTIGIGALFAAAATGLVLRRRRAMPEPPPP